MKTFHGLYVIAKEEEDEWVLRQASMSDNECMWFTLVSYDDGKISLKTCGDKYVTAPRTGATPWDWRLGLVTEPNDCAKFTAIKYGKDKFAFETCDFRFFTAGDGNWPSVMRLLVIANTKIVENWEIFTLLPP